MVVEQERKHYDEPLWRPYGGATSFEEIDSQKAMQEYVMSVDMETYALRGIIENISNDSEMEAGEKAAAIEKAAADFRKRVTAIQMPEGHKSLWEKFKAFIGSPASETVVDNKTIRHEGSKWVIYSKEGKRLGSYDSEEAAKKRLRQIEFFKHQDSKVADHGFKIYEANDGDLRWLCYSSNAFEDRDEELFTTKALEEAVEYADKTGERGPLLLYHVPSAEIGHCDFQAVVGRFLVESGTFDDTPLGNKAVEYFIDSDEEHQVSIGYEYQDGDEKDGVYDWLRIKERSITPYGAAANPWTSFKIVGEETVDETKKNWLTKVFGEELVTKVISDAESKTKEREDAGTRFKSKDALTLDEIKSLVGKEGDELKGSILAIIDKYDAKEEPAPEASKEDPAPASAPDNATSFGTEQLQNLAALITNLSTQVEELVAVKSTVEQLQAEVKELKKSDDDKVADIITPRWKLPEGSIPSQNSNNVIDITKNKDFADVLKDGDPNQDQDPIAPYIQDLVAGRVVRE